MNKPLDKCITGIILRGVLFWKSCFFGTVLLCNFLKPSIFGYPLFNSNLISNFFRHAMFIINGRVYFWKNKNASLYFNSIQYALKISLQPYNWSAKNISGRFKQKWGLRMAMMQLGLYNI